MSGHLDRLISALSDPGAYPHRPDSVHVIQTHISVVFIAGDLVYKIKKPVNFGFLDFTILEKRKYFCEREVVLNSRFSEGIYLGVVPIYEGPEGINLNGPGHEIEAAVLMKRLPEDRSMIRMLEDDLVTPALLDRLADRLATLHAQAPTGPEIASHGSFAVIAQNLRENFDQTGPFIGRTIDASVHKAVQALSMDFMRTHRELFHSRITGGFIRDCHGDLHLDHVIIINGIILYDCIEFNDRFRYGDTASDLGFLLMDLEFRGWPAFSERLAQRYAHSSGDGDILKLLGFYKSYRAFVRGKVTGFTLDEPEVPQPEKEAAVLTARDYFALSLACLKPPPPPVLIVTCGLMGTGKSFLAARLGKRLGIEPLRSDVVRKEICAVPHAEHRLDKYGQGIYRTKATERTYQALLEKAQGSLQEGKSAILDASFMRRKDRIQAHNLAEGANARFVLIECVCPEGVIRARLDERMRLQTDPSDARWEIFEDQKRQFEPMSRDERICLHQWDSTTDPDAFLTDLVRELVVQQCGL